MSACRPARSPKDRLKAITSESPDSLDSSDERPLLERTLALIEKEAATSAKVKDALEALLAKVAAQYGRLSEDEIKTLAVGVHPTARHLTAEVPVCHAHHVAFGHLLQPADLGHGVVPVLELAFLHHLDLLQLQVLHLRQSLSLLPDAPEVFRAKVVVDLRDGAGEPRRARRGTPNSVSRGL